MSRKFGTVPVALWRMGGFKRLTPSAKLAALFLWSGPHTGSAGCFVLPDAYAQSDLGLGDEQWKQARKELEEAKLVIRDSETDEYLVTGFLAANKPAPSNAKLITAIKGQISAVASEPIRDLAWKEFEAHCTAERPQPPQATVTAISPALRQKLTGEGFIR